jgi:hypothetical protein
MVTRVDVEQALSGFVAAAFWRAGQQKGQGQQGEGAGGVKGWQDVGEACVGEGGDWGVGVGGQVGGGY